jgi:hypothetical protein
MDSRLDDRAAGRGSGRRWAWGDGHERGVSDVISFVLVFSLIAASVGIVYVTGFTGLENARNSERIENAERAFDVLADNLADIYRDGAPSRKTEIKLSDSQVELGEPTVFNVTVQDETTGGNPTTYRAESRPLVFRLSDDRGERVVYEGGAVMRTSRNGGVLLNEPPLLIRENRTVLSYVILASSTRGSQAQAGDGTILVRTVSNGRQLLLQDEDGDSNVTLRISTTDARAQVWARYVNDQADWSGVNWNTTGTPPCDTTSIGGGRSQVVCTFAPEEFYVTSTGIETTITQ